MHALMMADLALSKITRSGTPANRFAPGEAAQVDFRAGPVLHYRTRRSSTAHLGVRDDAVP
jgi:hypothetical protein